MDRPSVSIITVSYNSEATIERTLKSVLMQTVSPIEYHIVDGGSSDNTLPIVESMRPDFEAKGIAYIVTSEVDNGIYDAMNKGIKRAKGNIIGMINSDDWYEEIAIETVTETYLKSPFDLFYADLRMHMPNGQSFIKHSRNRKYSTSRDWNHPTTFVTKEIYNKYQYKNDTIHDDYDFILRVKKSGANIVVNNTVLANFTMNGTSHERNVKKAMNRVMIKYRIYRNNGYSSLYFFECFMVELLKLIIG